MFNIDTFEKDLSAKIDELNIAFAEKQSDIDPVDVQAKLLFILLNDIKKRWSEEHEAFDEVHYVLKKVFAKVYKYDFDSINYHSED